MTVSAKLSEQEIKALRDGCVGVTAGPWRVYEGSSWRRIGSEHPSYSRIAYDMAVVAPTKASDGHPDLTATSGDCEANLAHLARCDPQTITALCDMALATLSGRSEEGGADGFTTADFQAALSPLLSGHEVIIKAGLSNNFNIIIAALRRAINRAIAGDHP